MAEVTMVYLLECPWLCDQQSAHSEPDDRIPGTNNQNNQHGDTTSATQNI